MGQYSNLFGPFRNTIFEQNPGLGCIASHAQSSHCKLWQSDATEKLFGGCFRWEMVMICVEIYIYIHMIRILDIK